MGISCAGSASAEAIALLEPLTSDVVDFVRQGALIAMAMVLVQTTDAREPRVGSFRLVNLNGLSFTFKLLFFLPLSSLVVLIAGANWRRSFWTNMKTQ